MMLDIFATVLATPLATFLSGRIFGTSTLGSEVAGGAISYAENSFKDYRKARVASRKIEDLAFSLVDQLAVFAEQERLDPDRAEQVARDLLSASTALDLGREIAKAGREPGPLGKAIVAALPEGADTSDEKTGIMVAAFADGLCRIAGALPEYERGKDQELFGELDALIAAQESVGRDLSSLRREFSAITQEWQNVTRERLAAVDQNEKQYRDALYRFASQVKLLGLEGDRHEAGRELPIETAYVPLRLRARDPSRTLRVTNKFGVDDIAPGEEVSEITWPEVLALLPYLGNRLIVEGIGGSGKTTLLQWTAVEALRAEENRDVRHPGLATAGLIERFRRTGLSDSAEPWNGNASDRELVRPWFDRVPLFIRLRQSVDGRLPSPQDLPSLIAKTAVGTSEHWVRQVVNDGRALFLIDGIDEVPGEARDRVAEDIEAYLRDYRGCALIATSRPAAVQDAQWARLFGSCRLSVKRMERPEIEAFVKHWYKSYGVARREPRDEKAVARLLGQIEARPGLIGLMDTPLLAASICFLNKDRIEELPTRSAELYGQLCRQLVHQLDEERLHRSGYEALVPALRGLEPNQKLHLLSELGRLMITNRSAALETDQAVSRIRHELWTIGRDHGREPRDVLHALQERSGLLRGSTPGAVEFAHNNLRGWLAAQAFAQNDEYVLPIERAFDLNDFDLPVLAAFQSDKNYRHRLIGECLRLAKENSKRARTVMIMALRCGQTGAIDAEYRLKLDGLVGLILPPCSPDEASWLAELGETIVARLAAAPDRDARVDAACVRCLRLIGGSASKGAMLGYLQHEEENVVDELAQALPPLSVPRLRDYVLSKWFPEMSWRSYLPARHVTSNDLKLFLKDIAKANYLCLSNTAIGDLEPLRGLTALQTLSFDNTQVADLEPLRGLTALQALSFDNARVDDLDPLRGLAALQTLSFDNTQVADLDPLRGLTALQTLSFDNTQVADLEPLRGLTALQTLSFDDTRVVGLEPLRGLTALQHLWFRSTPVTDLDPLRGLTALQRLSFISTQVADLEPLCGLTALRTLLFEDTQVANLDPLHDLTALWNLWFRSTQVADLDPLRRLTALKILWFDNTQVADLDPLRGLTALQNVSFNNTQVADLGPLRGLTALENVSFSKTQVADLDPLRGLTALENVSFSRTQVADLDPLRGLTALQNLSFNNTQVADLDALRGLTALQNLSFDNTQIADLDPLRGLTALRSLSFDNTQIADLDPLRGLTALQALSFDNAQVVDLDPLRGLSALRRLPSLSDKM